MQHEKSLHMRRFHCQQSLTDGEIVVKCNGSLFQEKLAGKMEHFVDCRD